MTNLLTATVVVITELTTVRATNLLMRATFCPQVRIADSSRTFFLAKYSMSSTWEIVRESRPQKVDASTMMNYDAVSRSIGVRDFPIAANAATAMTFDCSIGIPGRQVTGFSVFNATRDWNRCQAHCWYCLELPVAWAWIFGWHRPIQLPAIAPSMKLAAYPSLTLRGDYYGYRLLAWIGWQPSWVGLAKDVASMRQFDLLLDFPYCREDSKVSL